MGSVALAKDLSNLSVDVVSHERTLEPCSARPWCWSPMNAHLLDRKATHFVLWRPRITTPAPELVLGQIVNGNPPDFKELLRAKLAPSSLGADLWEIEAAQLHLGDGEIYHYWFEVNAANPYRPLGGSPARILCTDPIAWAVDWRLLAPRPDGPFGDDDRMPASVVRWKDGELSAADPGGEVADFSGEPGIKSLPKNERLVLYELPTAWARREDGAGSFQMADGTFRDARALVDSTVGGSDFSGLPVLEKGRAHLRTLGVNGLELLPPADSYQDREWGYGTTNYFAPDYDLGFPERHLSPTANQDLADLIRACHQNGIRFFADVVMAFATRCPYREVNFLDLFVQFGTGDPEQAERDGFGGDLFKYGFFADGYDPVTGKRLRIAPARQLMKTDLLRWMNDFHIDGLRLDSIPNIKNYDFIQEYKDIARQTWRERAASQGLSQQDADVRFLVVGEELAVKFALLAQQRLDGLWNERFKERVRAAILGRSVDGESFEWTVRKMIDCRLLSDGDGSFTDLSQSVNYVTSHDVGGFGNERLYTYLGNNGIVEREQRIKLAFACLFTAVGIPMIFAGEEFADDHDLPPTDDAKQVDPVNFDRLEGPANEFRRRILAYVARLVRLRTTSNALAMNDTRFVHVDFEGGKRVVAWQRGPDGGGAQVVVVANFSDWGTADPTNSRAVYEIPNFPRTPPGRRWREVTQERDVPAEWIGKEPVYPWEAKVYALV